jgi:chromosome segregation ATPase
MITIIALSFHYILYFLKRQDMTILTREERERLVLDLYNQGKTYREISKEARISPRDIGVILNKLVEEKNGESKEADNVGKQEEEKKQHLSVSTQAYKLFSEGKTPLEVTIALNLRESEATKFCREYWKLKQLYNLSMVYEEIKDDITSFLKLYKLVKAKGIGVQQVVDILAIANNDLPAIEERFKRLRTDVRTLQSQKYTCKRNLYQLNNQIASTSRLLNSLRISCERERKEIENLYNEKMRLEAAITEFKSNNEEYLKIKQAAEENVKTVLTNSKILLNFATASIIESLRRNPELCNFVLNDNDTTSYGSNYLSLMSSGQQQQQSFNYLNDSICTAVILEEAQKLYNELTTKLTNEVMTAAAADIRAS